MKKLHKMKALAEEAKNVGIESERTGLASAEQTAVKKKVKIVKKIVKKKVIKKVPKRVAVASNSNTLELPASPNPNDDDYDPIEDEEPVPVEIENPNVVVNHYREDESMQEFQVRDGERGLSVETDYCCRNVSEYSGLVSAPLLDDQDPIELHDTEIDTNDMDAEEHEGEEGVKEHDEKIQCVTIEGGLSNDVKGEEGMKEQMDKREHIDLQPTDSFEDQEEVKELVKNSEIDCLRPEHALHETGAPGCERVALGRHMKQMTKIFIHGLDKDTKEEDIRKVFQEVGEVVEVKIITNLRSGKSQGFGFVRYASAGLANLALTKYHSVKICGSLCHTAAVEGNDTILLVNIDKEWNSEYVLALLQNIGIKKIADVSVVADPENTKLNLGFTYLGFERKSDAEMAYNKLQNKNVFGKHSNIKVGWAESFSDSVEEEMHNIKSVFCEHIPASWDEKEVRDQFKIFGEIESIALAKNLYTAKRNDFAFINYKTREAALLCIEALTSKQSNSYNGPKAHLKVSLARSLPKSKPIMTISEPATTEVSKVKQRPNQGRLVYNPNNMKVTSISRHEDSRKDGGSSTTAELVQLLREQASWKLGGGPTSTTGMSTGQHRQPLSRGTQAFTQMGSESLYDPKAFHATHLQNPRPIVNHVAMPSAPHFNQQRAHYYPNGSFSALAVNPTYFQTRGQATYPGSSSVYRQMH